MYRILAVVVAALVSCYFLQIWACSICLWQNLFTDI